MPNEASKGHTPTPWGISEHNSHWIFAEGKLGSIFIADCEDHSAEHIRSGQVDNAAFIVQAVNSHEALVARDAAWARLVNAMESHAEWLRLYNESLNEDKADFLDIAWQEVLDARAALRSAGVTL